MLNNLHHFSKMLTEEEDKINRYGKQIRIIGIVLII